MHKKMLGLQTVSGALALGAALLLSAPAAASCERTVLLDEAFDGLATGEIGAAAGWTGAAYVTSIASMPAPYNALPSPFSGKVLWFTSSVTAWRALDLREVSATFDFYYPTIGSTPNMSIFSLSVRSPSGDPFQLEHFYLVQFRADGQIMIRQANPETKQMEFIDIENAVPFDVPFSVSIDIATTGEITLSFDGQEVHTSLAYPFELFEQETPPVIDRIDMAWSPGSVWLGGGPILDNLVIEGVTATLAADLNADGAVDGADLGLLLLDWGQAGSPADLNGDGVVDGADLGLLLLSWGECP